MEQESLPKSRRRGIYLLPNLLTTAALFAGYYAIVMAIHGRFEVAAIAIYVAMLLDGLDGRVARLTATQSAFGAEYDSLSDMVSFGLAPSLVVYQWSLQGLGKLGWLAAFVYAAGTALRLARFNTQLATADRRYFRGLPSPAAAAAVSGLVWVGTDFGLAGSDLSYAAFAITIAAGVLMVSNLRYNSFKEIDLKGKIPFVTVLLIVLAFVFVSINPPQILFTLAGVYLISGPIITLVNVRRRRVERRARNDPGSPSA